MPRLGTKEPLHCATYTLLSRTRSPHNVLQSPSYIKILNYVYVCVCVCVCVMEVRCLKGVD